MCNFAYKRQFTVSFLSWVSFVGVFWASSKQPNDQLMCSLSKVCEIGGSNQREKGWIGKSQRNRVPPRQCKISHICSNKYKTTEAWLVSDVASPIQHRPCTIIIINFEVYKTLWMVITMTSNRNCLSYLSLPERWKRSSNRVQDIEPIKVNFFHRKKWTLIIWVWLNPAHGTFIHLLMEHGLCSMSLVLMEYRIT